MEAKRSSSFQSSPSASRPHVQEYHPTKQLKKVVSGPPQLGFLPQGFGDSMKMLDGLFQMNTNEMSSGSPPPEFSSRSSNPALAGAGSATRDQNQDQADLTPEEAVFAERCRKLSHWKARLAAVSLRQAQIHLFPLPPPLPSAVWSSRSPFPLFPSFPSLLLGFLPHVRSLGRRSSAI